MSVLAENIITSLPWFSLAIIDRVLVAYFTKYFSDALHRRL